MPQSDQPRRVCPGEGFIETCLLSGKGAKRHQMAHLMLQLSLHLNNQMLNKSPCFPSCCWDQTNRQQCANAHLRLVQSEAVSLRPGWVEKIKG